MKSLLIYLFAGIMVIQASGQTVTGYCWDFEQGCSNPDNSFYLGCIPNARSSHGTPDNAAPSGGDPVPAPTGGQLYAHMYARFFPSCPNGTGLKGEGILLQFNFLANKTYKISFIGRMRYPAFNNHQLGLFLVNNMPNATGGSDPVGCGAADGVPAIPASNQMVKSYGGTSFSTTSWGSYSETFTAGTAFNQLWFRPVYTGPNEGTNHWYIDNVCIEEVQCPGPEFSVSFCKVETHSIRTTVTKPAAAGTWQLFQALDCDGGTGANNIGAPASLNWIDPAQTIFDVPFWSGCYILQFTAAPGTNGCPEAIHREIIDSKYAGKHYILGNFEYAYETECSPPTYSMSFYPPQNYIWIFPPFPSSGSSNEYHTWELYDMSNLSVPIATWNNAYINATLNYGTAYLMKHWVTTTLDGYCLVSDVHWIVFGCGHQESGPSSGSYSLVPGNDSSNEALLVALTPKDRNSMSDKPAPKSTISPNPVSNSSVVLQTGVTDGESYTVMIFNTTGQLVKSYSDVSDASLLIEQGALQSGTHIVQVRYADGRQETLKLIVL